MEENKSSLEKLKEIAKESAKERLETQQNYLNKTIALQYAIQTVDNEGEKITADQLIVAAKKIEDYLNNK